MLSSTAYSAISITGSSHDSMIPHQAQNASLSSVSDAATEKQRYRLPPPCRLKICPVQNIWLISAGLTQLYTILQTFPTNIFTQFLNPFLSAAGIDSVQPQNAAAWIKARQRHRCTSYPLKSQHHLPCSALLILQHRKCLLILLHGEYMGDQLVHPIQPLRQLFNDLRELLVLMPGS